MKFSRLPTITIPFIFAIISGCGGGSNSTQGDGGTAQPNQGTQVTLLTQTSEPPSNNCPNGGIAVHAGIDLNSNGRLDAQEISGTQHVCHGTNGANAFSALVATDGEPAGTNCASGGTRIRVGLDSNTNNVLDSQEVSSTRYVCNGSNGQTGISTLQVIEGEPAGANCTHGGSKVSAGLDSNRNSILDAAEISSTGYVCNGAPGGVTFVEVTDTTIQATANTGYIANHASDQVSITLPTAPPVGSVVHVEGAGPGGWRIVQNDGQQMVTREIESARGGLWTARDSNRYWRAIASSADGMRLAAVVDPGQIYTSTDAGVSWVARESTREWGAIASSADGTRLAAVVDGGQIYTSTDGGVTWTARESNRRWYSIASSTDGTRLAAANFGGQIYTSTDGGVTWTARESNRRWISITSSADGTRLAAVVNEGQIYTSTDSGVSWTPTESIRDWFSIASSSDGTRLAAVVSFGQIYTSTDSGVTWTPKESIRDWRAIASSADGRRLVAVENGGKIRTSNDGGATWTARESDRNWQSVASSADGTRLTAAVSGGQIYTSSPFTTLGTTGGISGPQFAAIQLRYLGGGIFNVSSHTGELTAF